MRLENLLIIGAVWLTLLTGPVLAGEKFPYKCIENTPEIPTRPLTRFFKPSYRTKLARAPYAGYVCLSVQAVPGNKVEIKRTISSVPKGFWDQMAREVATNAFSLNGVTGTRIEPEIRIHVLVYTATQPRMVIGIMEGKGEGVAGPIVLTDAMVAGRSLGRNAQYQLLFK